VGSKSYGLDREVVRMRGTGAGSSWTVGCAVEQRTGRGRQEEASVGLSVTGCG
jgi:hypothetical protein